MNVSVIIAAVALPFSVLSALSGYLGFRTAEKQRSVKESRDLGELKSEIRHILGAIDDISRSQKEIRLSITKLSERIARLEEGQKYLGEKFARQNE